MPKKDAEEDDAEEEVENTDGDDAAPDKPRRKFDMWHSAKLGAYVLFIYVVLMSDVFIERVMAGASIGLVEGRVPTAYGVGVQGVLLVLGLIIVDFLISKEVL